MSETATDTTEITPDEDTTDTETSAVEASDDAAESPETFPREYVEQLRAEAAEARVKAKDRDEVAHRLHTALVAATGRLADPTDMTFDEAHLADPEALTAAIDALLEAKPHLASRTPRGDVGQGATGAGDDFSLAGILRAGAA